MEFRIVTPDDTRAMARADHARGVGREEHGMNWHAAALPVWLAEWDRCEAERRERASQVAAEV